MKFLGIFAGVYTFFDFAQWFRAKTTWETHPTGFLSTKNEDVAFSKIFKEIYVLSKKVSMVFLETHTEKHKIPFFWLENSTLYVSIVVHFF